MRLLGVLPMLCAISACSEQPKREVYVEVVNIAEHANPKWHPNELVVTARSPDGAVGSKSVLRAFLHCRVGDTVHGYARGMSLTLDERTCRS